MNPKDHEVFAERNPIKLGKGDTNDARPHVQWCPGCLRERVCHGCGLSIGPRMGIIGVNWPCTSGACQACCAKLHRQPGTP